MLGIESQEEIADKNRRSQEDIAKANRNMQALTALKQRELQEREGERNRSLQESIARKQRELQAHEGYENRTNQINIEQARLDSQREAARVEFERQKALQAQKLEAERRNTELQAYYDANSNVYKANTRDGSNNNYDTNYLDLMSGTPTDTGYDYGYKDVTGVDDASRTIIPMPKPLKKKRM